MQQSTAYVLPNVKQTRETCIKYSYMCKVMHVSHVQLKQATGRCAAAYFCLPTLEYNCAVDSCNDLLLLCQYQHEIRCDCGGQRM